jgi:hypothetical protein
MAAGLNLWVNIGAKLLPSINSAATGIEKRFGMMNRRLKIQAAETKLAYKEMAAAMKPLAAMAVAGGLTMGLKGIIGEGAEYQHQIVMMRNAGRSAKEMAAAIGAANRTIMDVPTSTINGNLRMLQETTLAFGGIEHAIENLQFNTRMGSMMKNIMGEDYDEVHGFNQLVRALEIRGGKMKAGDYQRQASLLYKAFSVSGGTVNPEGVLGFMQQAGVAARGYSERFLTSVVPSLIQEFGGERAGTMSTALFNQFMGRVPIGGKALTEEWIRLGLVPPNGTPQNLSVKGWDPGSLKGNAIAMSNPLEWVETVMMPAMRAHGIDTNNKDQMLLQAQKMFGRETGKRLASTLFDPKQLERIHADQKLYDKAMGPDAAFANAMRTDPKMALASTAASLKNLETNLGKSLFSPAGIAAVNSIARGINWLAGAFDHHPNFARGVTALIGFGAVTAVLRVFGISLRGLVWPLRAIGGLVGRAFAAANWEVGISVMGRLAPRAGWLGLALAGIAAALVLIVAKWNGIKAFFAGMATGFSKALSPQARAGFAKLGGFFRGLAPVFAGVGRVLHMIIDPLGSLYDLLGEINSKTHIFSGLFGQVFGAPVLATWRSWGEAAGGAVGRVADALGRLIGLVSGAARAMAGLFSGAGTPGVPIAIGLKGAPKGPDAAMRPGGMKAGGGTVTRGHWYQINEKGQELFAPGRTGTIIPHSESRKAMSGGGGDPRSINFYISGVTDPKAVASAVHAELARLSAGNSAYLND